MDNLNLGLDSDNKCERIITQFRESIKVLLEYSSAGFVQRSEIIKNTLYFHAESFQLVWNAIKKTAGVNSNELIENNLRQLLEALEDKRREIVLLIHAELASHTS